MYRGTGTRQWNFFIWKVVALNMIRREENCCFRLGSGGIVNSNVLHMTKAISQKEKNIQLLHIFDVSLLAGEQGSRIEQKYIAPIITAPQIEVIPLFPGNAEEERILKLLAASFRLSSDEFGYEIKLRETLTEIWLMLFELSRPMREKKGEHNKSNDKNKADDDIYSRTLQRENLYPGTCGSSIPKRKGVL